MDGLLSGYTPYVIGGTVVAAASVLYRRKYMPVKKRPRIVRRDFPANTVVVHQIGQGPYAPSLSPFPVKLETYLRIAKIPYLTDHTNGMSSKGKTPWISYNNDEIPDSEFCIEYLNKKFDVDLNKHLSQEEKAIARAFQRMVDEHLYWVLVMGRWLTPEYKEVQSRVLAHLKFNIQRSREYIRSCADGQGMGRHSTSEIEHIGETDFAAISHYLGPNLSTLRFGKLGPRISGQKEYLMGAEPCEADCAVFGMLAQSKWHMPGCHHETHVNETFPNLSAYCERMKERFWPDWDDCITHGGTKIVSKY